MPEDKKVNILCSVPGGTRGFKSMQVRGFSLEKKREWIFSGGEKDNRILLVDESGVFGWKINIDDVDWEAYRRSKEERLSPQAQTLQA